MKHLTIIILIATALACAKADDDKHEKTAEIGFSFNFWTTRRTVDVPPEDDEYLVDIFIDEKDLAEIRTSPDGTEHNIELEIRRKPEDVSE